MDEILYPPKKHDRRTPPPPNLDMFDDRPSWIAQPETDLERRFADFHRRNPRVYDALELRALALVNLGRTRIGIAELVEELRYDARLVTRGDTFKINNSFRSFYSRLLIHNHSKLASIIGIREQTNTRSEP